MRRGLASAFAAVALLAIVGSNVTAAGDREIERMAQEGPGVMHAADDRATGSALASVNRNSTFAPDKAVSTLKGEDPESLRLELIGCLFTMLIVTVGALLGICCFDHRTVQREAWPTNEEPREPPAGRCPMS